jgi:hypothetical protein
MRIPELTAAFNKKFGMDKTRNAIKAALNNHILRWDTDVKCPQYCELAPHCHPMVWDEHHAGHKLCTLTVIKAGLIKRKELI